MLEKPAIPDDTLLACIRDEYGLHAESLTFLPLGADVNTAVYRLEAGGAAYFLKLRGGAFNEAAVAVPKYLNDHGLAQVIPSLRTRSGSLWASLPPYHVILYPFVEGHHGYERKLTPAQWAEFGAALKSMHRAEVPPALTGGIPREDFSPRWREAVRAYLARIHAETFADPAAAELAAFLKSKSAETLALVARAEELARSLQERPGEFVLCHGDIHGWNLLIDPRGALYIVDWDTLVFAPRERDLMFIGAGLGDSGYTPEEEEALFYQGYGRAEIDGAALAYYRFERIVEDIAAFCEQILSSAGSGEDRMQALVYLKSNYRRGNTIERAYAADRAFRA